MTKKQKPLTVRMGHIEDAREPSAPTTTKKPATSSRAAQRFEESEQPLHVRIPVGLHRALRMQALQEGTTTRALTIQALEALLSAKKQR